MTGEDYWTYMASFITDDSPPASLPFSASPLLRLSHVREAFQKGLVLVLAGDDRRGRAFMRNFMLRIEEIPTGLITHQDAIRRYTALWITSGQEDQELIKKALELLAGDMLAQSFRTRSRELYQVLAELGMAELGSGFSPASPEEVEPGGDEKFKCENAADLLVEMSRLLILMGDSIQACKTAEMAGKLYEASQEAAKKKVIQENSLWAKFWVKNNSWVNKRYPDEAQAYFSRRRCLLGNIPLFHFQANLLRDMAQQTFFSYSMAHKGLRKRFDYFFAKYISSPQRKSSVMGIVDETEWLLIKKKFCLQMWDAGPGLTPGKILRMCLQ
jgi:hypothetical protein